MKIDYAVTITQNDLAAYCIKLEELKPQLDAELEEEDYSPYRRTVYIQAQSILSDLANKISLESVAATDDPLSTFEEMSCIYTTASLARIRELEAIGAGPGATPEMKLESDSLVDEYTISSECRYHSIPQLIHAIPNRVEVPLAADVVALVAEVLCLILCLNRQELELLEEDEDEGEPEDEPVLGTA